MSTDPVAKAIADDAHGRNGVYTHTPSGAIGYSDFLRQQRQSAQPIVVSGGSSSGPYQMLPLFEDLLDKIPWWVGIVMAAIGVAIAFLFLAPVLPNWPLVAVLGASAVGGAVSIHLIIRLVDIAVQLTFALLKFAIGLAIVAAILYGIYVYISGAPISFDRPAAERAPYQQDSEPFVPLPSLGLGRD